MTRPVPIAQMNQLLHDELAFFLIMAFQTLNPNEKLRWNWHIDAMCHALSVTVSKDGSRLVITIPPRHLKSITISVAFVAWMMGRDPTLKFMVASYGGELASELARQFRTVVTSAWFKRAFPRFRIERSIDGEITTTMGGCRKAVSVGGATTGFGADYIIVDDLMKATDASFPALREASIDYFKGSLVSRLNDPERGRIIVIAQRLHEVDVPGTCIETGLYRHLNLPAIAQRTEVIDLGDGETRLVKPGDLLFLSQKSLDRIKAEQGPAFFAAQYLQDPTPPESLFIKWHAIQRYVVAPSRRQFKKVAQSWDTAHLASETADYSVCTTWGFYEGKWYLLDLDRFKADYVTLRDRVRANRDRWRADVLVIEDKGNGTSLLSDLRFEHVTQSDRERDGCFWKLHAVTPIADKATRWAAGAGRLEAGEAVFPEDAPWMEVLRREVISFPNARNDDQVDSISQFLEFTRLRTGRNLMIDYKEELDRRARVISRDMDDDDDDDAYWHRHRR
jgi:predicted phage terminase large subunit-like protein